MIKYTEDSIRITENEYILEKNKIIKCFKEKNLELNEVQELVIKKLGKKEINDIHIKSDEFEQILKDYNIDFQFLVHLLLPYGDPTYEINFKSLFGNNKNKEIIICLLNGLIGFTGDKQIKELRINSEKFDLTQNSIETGKSNLQEGVGVLCKTEGGQKIAIEIHRSRHSNFLAYESQDNEYHNVLFDDTYILILLKENFFTGQNKLKDDNIYEIDVVPMITGLNIELPGNKIHWKFFELPKFKQHDDYKNITKDSDLKLQFLEFLTDCGTQLYEPERHNIIKKAYDLMKNCNLDVYERVLSWKTKINDADPERASREAISEAEKKGEMIGMLKGEKKGMLKYDIELIKNLLRKNTEKDEIDSMLPFLNRKRYGDKFDKFINHISANINKNANEICEDLDLMNIEINHDDSSI